MFLSVMLEGVDLLHIKVPFTHDDKRQSFFVVVAVAMNRYGTHSSVTSLSQLQCE